MELPKQPVFSVSQVTFAIKGKLEAAFPSILVKGEVSNFKRQASGHCYFSLKDTQSQISAVMFRGHAAKLRQLPKEGDQVICQGQINVYPPRGQYQLVVSEMTFEGLGALLLQLEQLKEKLKAMGYFDPARKRAIPPFPKRIGVVTSPTGAAIQDMLHILNRRSGGFHLILNPVKVQGEGSAEEIAQAIDQFNAHRLVDVMIVGRGGGSIEDLWAFNEEVVANAIYRSQIPVISAVGHETDTTLADLVADLRAPTPSAAAEIVLKERSLLLDTLTSYRRQMAKIVYDQVQRYREKLNGMLLQPVLTHPYALLGPYIQKLDDYRLQSDRLIQGLVSQKQLIISQLKKQLHTLNPKTQINYLREKVHSYSRSLHQAMIYQNLAVKKGRLKELEVQFAALNPKNLLKKGYSILFSEKEGSAITSCRQAKKGEKIIAQVYDGSMTLTIEDVRET